MSREGHVARLLSLVLVVVVTSACPDDDVGVGSGDETGGDSGVPAPIDPLDGAGADPPGDPDPDATWKPPSSLGNGLVHDSRYDLQVSEHAQTFSAAELVAGVEWAGFVGPHATKIANGFRPTQVDAEVSLAAAGGGMFELSLHDRSVYLCDDDANYRSVTKTYVFGSLAQEQSLAGSGPANHGGPRPSSIDTFALPGGRVGASVVWTWDKDPMLWHLVLGQDQQTFEATVSELRSAGYRPISVASRVRDGVDQYAGIFVRDAVPWADWRVMLGYDSAAVNDETPTLWAEGYYPFRRTAAQGAPNAPRFNLLWIKRSPGLKLELRTNMDAAWFEGEDIEWRRRGYHLESACAYAQGGAARHAGLWVREEPYLRWEEGLEIDMGTTDYVNRHAPFHVAAIQAMTFVGTEREGDFFRPSGTLHIFEGAELVLNRAYTYAGASYPDTPIDAPMLTASASKSITAAAVVRELGVKNMSVKTLFAALAGIDVFDVPEMVDKPLVVDVLRNLGGFESNVTSYDDHSMIDESPHGQYPITGEMMYEYAIDGLKNNDPDRYWNLITYAKSQEQGVFVYSNPGFSMLGELVRVQSGLTYEDYVRTNLLEPLNLDGKVFPDAGHRNAVDEPTLAGKGSYLINDMHPYRCDGDACIGAVVPLTGSEPVPEPKGGDNSPTWSINTGPPDPSAPAAAAVLRYAGTSYMGGAPLAAGGWHADGESLGILIRAIAQSSYLMPQSVAAELWSPTWWNAKHKKGGGRWYYGLGWYIRGNWVAMAGGADGSMSLVLHNRAYDFTVVYLTNTIGNAFGEFLNPLLNSPELVWSSPISPQSILGAEFPCIDDLVTPQADECGGSVAPY